MTDKEQVSARTEFGRSFWHGQRSLDADIGEVNPRDIGDEQFRVMVDHLPTLCWMARGDGYIVWYNKRWHDYCGTTPEQMEGWGWQSVHDPATLPSVMERWTRSIASGEPFEMVFPLRGADGVFRPFLTRVSPYRDASGSIVRWFGVNSEIGAQLEAEKALRASESKFAVLTDAMPQMVWSTLPDGFHDYYNAQWYAFTGVPAGSTDGEGWSGMFHPDDQERAWERWRYSLSTGEPYEIEYRLRHHSGNYRWTLGRALPVRDVDGTITRWIGTCTDIHDAKLIAEHNELLSRELSHRIKNIFAVIAGLIGISARREPAVAPFARDLGGRIAALGRAHDFARPHSEASRPTLGQTSLHGMARELLKPYVAFTDDRIGIRGDDAPVDDRGATPLALAFHELATNSAKYGALSHPEGRLEIVTRRNGSELTVEWTETGGPQIDTVPSHTGFGSQLTYISIEQQLGGTMRREWRREGLHVEILVEDNRLVRGNADQASGVSPRKS